MVYNELNFNKKIFKRLSRVFIFGFLGHHCGVGRLQPSEITMHNNEFHYDDLLVEYLFIYIYFIF